MLKQCDIGDTIVFGNYHGANEWLVLDKQNGKVLLISKDCLDTKPYNEEYEPVTWETCTLRQWLNGEFINGAFAEKEKALICDTYLQNPDNPKEGTDGGNDTTDKVFLLSIDEAEKYFDNTVARRAGATDYAIANGIGMTGSGGSYWWLRSPGSVNDRAASVSYDGYVEESGERVNGTDYTFNGYIDVNYGVRPAIWVNIGK